jgi:rubrerythrin
MSMAERVWELLDFANSRTTWVKGSMASASGATTLLSADLGRAVVQEMSDVDIMQFALTLEHLEAAMYTQMVAMNWSRSKEVEYIQSFAQHEAAHVDALTRALQAIGEEPVMAMTGYQFPPFDTRIDMLNFAKTTEDVGVGAYQGAATAIGNKDYLAVAGSIVQVEARHAAIINLLLGLDPVPAAMTPTMAPDEVLQAVNPLLGM